MPAEENGKLEVTDEVTAYATRRFPTLPAWLRCAFTTKASLPPTLVPLNESKAVMAAGRKEAI